MSVFGDLYGGDQVDAAVIANLTEWMPTYLKEVARQRSISETLEPPRSIVAVSEFDRWPEEQLPSIVIVNPGMADSPRNEGGSYSARWELGIYISVAAATQGETRRNSQLYIAAARGCLMHRRSLTAGMKGIDWDGESYTAIAVDKRRSLAGASANFTVERENVLTVGAGPTSPDDIPGEWPTVKAADAVVQKTN